MGQQQGNNISQERSHMAARAMLCYAMLCAPRVCAPLEPGVRNPQPIHHSRPRS